MNHLKTSEERERFENALRNDTVVLGRFYQILEDWTKDLDNRELNLDSYNSPSFAYLVADRMGERRTLNRIKELFNFLKE